LLALSTAKLASLNTKMRNEFTGPRCPGHQLSIGTGHSRPPGGCYRWAGMSNVGHHHPGAGAGCTDRYRQVRISKRLYRYVTAPFFRPDVQPGGPKNQRIAARSAEQYFSGPVRIAAQPQAPLPTGRWRDVRAVEGCRAACPQKEPPTPKYRMHQPTLRPRDKWRACPEACELIGTPRLTARRDHEGVD
jgi:hypothetical protein